MQKNKHSIRNNIKRNNANTNANTNVNTNANANINANANTNSFNTINIKPIITVNIIPLNKEDLNDLLKLEWGDMLTSKKNIFIKILKKINCLNPRHHNIYYNDLKSGYGKFESDKITNILTMFIKNRTAHIRTIINKLESVLDKDYVSRLLSSLYKLETSQKKINELISQLKPILCNHAGVISESRKRIEMNDINALPSGCFR